MDKPAQNIQDSFLNNARKDKIVLTIYLMSGVKLSGRIKSFDKYSLVLETNNQEQLIFKHAISTVVTQKTSHSYSSSPPPRAHSAAAADAPGRTGSRGRLGGIETALRNAASERAILVGLDWKTRAQRGAHRTRLQAEESLDELAELAASAGAAIVERVIQTRPRSRSRHPDRPRQGRRTGRRREVAATPTW